MHRSIKILPFILLACASLLMSCASEESSDSGVIVAQTFFQIPRCNRLRVGIIYYVVDTDEFFFCDGRELLPVDLSGQDGQDGEDGEDGQNGQDGQDGTSCTVTNDGAGTVTIACEDGTFATISDGQDGQDGTSCTIADTAAGATITCGTDTVTITDGQDGSSCSASTDASGAVTISCDDGTSATIPAGGGGEVTVEALCNAIGINDLRAPNELGCPEVICPCFTEADILSASVTGCQTIVDETTSIPLVSRAETLPLSGARGEFFALAEVDTLGNYNCGSPETVELTFSRNVGQQCITIIENAVGPCETVAVLCDFDSQCADANSCTDDVCVEGVCSNPTEPDGTSCDDGAGQCFLGSCRPVLGGL